MSGSESTGSVRIGIPEVYVQMVNLNEQVIGLREDVRSLHQTNETNARTLEDHGDRIRSVERWMWAAPASLMTGMATAAVVLVR